jgi:hypothetical protein
MSDDPEPKLSLFSRDLLSKWGFNDGDTPDEILDYCDDHGIPYPADWHVTLRRLVREYLIPKLDQHVFTVDINTNHNPIRAAMVDGRDVESEWHRESHTVITPEWVEIPYSLVWGAAVHQGDERE